MPRHRTWQQPFYRDMRMTSATLVDTLWDQQRELCNVRSALPPADPAALAEAVAALDVDLLRYACALLRVRLEEAARLDCAQLIADSILEVADPGDPAEQWEKWLDLAPCWPTLAQTQWYHAVTRASSLVIEALQAGGIELDAKATEEIEAAVTALTLADLLPADDYARFFPALPGEAETA